MENMPTSPVEVTENVSVAPTVEEVKASIVEEMNALIAWVLSCQSLTFFAFETQGCSVLHNPDVIQDVVQVHTIVE